MSGGGGGWPARKEAARGLPRVSPECVQLPRSTRRHPGLPRAARPGRANPPLAPARAPASLPGTTPSSAACEAAQAASPCLFLSLGAFSPCQRKAAEGEFHGGAVLGAG